jgi:hypothetical protein
LFYVVILNAVKDPCISSLLSLLPVLKSVSSVKIRGRLQFLDSLQEKPSFVRLAHRKINLKFLQNFRPLENDFSLSTFATQITTRCAQKTARPHPLSSKPPQKMPIKRRKAPTEAGAHPQKNF